MIIADSYTILSLSDSSFSCSLLVILFSPSLFHLPTLPSFALSAFKKCKIVHLLKNCIQLNKLLWNKVFENQDWGAETQHRQPPESPILLDSVPKGTVRGGSVRWSLYSTLGHLVHKSCNVCVYTYLQFPPDWVRYSYPTHKIVESNNIL